MKQRTAARCVASLALAIASLLPPASVDGAGPPALLDDMEQAPALRLIDTGSSAKVLAQSLERGHGRFGAGVERVVLSVPAGSSAALAYDLPPATVIEELRFTAWISCNRPGAQLAATVVLPRSIDPRTGAARRLMLRSGKLGEAGDWRLLSMEGLPALLADQARVARASPGTEIDEHEAYVTQLVILAPGGPGPTELWVDQIAVHGVLNRPAKLAATAAAASQPKTRPAEPSGAAAAPRAGGASPRLPLAPRIIQWQGEPLALLKEIGFDALWMGRPPHETELAEAQRLGMFLVAPPPAPPTLAESGLGERYAPVIAWDLGQLADPREVDLAYQWALAIKRFESSPTRPVLLRPSGLAREASRIADVVVLGRPTVGSTQSWTDYAAWLSQQRRAARPGTPIWVTVDTHISSRAMAQLAALRGVDALAAVPASFREIFLATTATFGLQPRGFCFTSRSSLAAPGADARMRRLALELANLRLGLAEPWLARGKLASVARSSREDLTGLVLKVERSHLIVPLRWSDDASGAAAETRGPVSFILPGIPESSDVYVASISGSERLRATCVTGGLKIAVDRLPDDAFLLVTEDGYAFSHVERYLRQHAPRAAQARIELAALRRQLAAQAVSALSPEDVKRSGAAEELARVDGCLTAVVETMQRKDYGAAFQLAADADGILDVAERRLTAAVAGAQGGGAGPAPPRWATLADCAAVRYAVDRAAPQRQPVPGGDFERLAPITEGGWQRVENCPDGIKAAVSLSSQAPAEGRYCLDLDVRQTTSAGSPPTLPTPPVWVTSPPVPVPPGHLVEISGVARVPDVPLGSPDGLLVFDSIGGEESAVRISLAPSWTPFRLIRAVPAGAELRLTVALGGVGRAQIDALAYRYIPLNRQALARSPR
ncbi:MAG: hypothetical protein DCC67_05970 [Planctomycetota bacterium]|nr:MAG: hypothetical protein DCC67_05970 [Planctomycetota bacterium]